MEERKLNKLKRELKLKEFQFNSLYEFSSSIYSSFQIDSVLRIFFSTLMGQLGISRAFFFDSENQIFRRKGFQLTDHEIMIFNKYIKKTGWEWFYLKTNDLSAEVNPLKNLLLTKKIHYLVSISEGKNKYIVLGLGYKFNTIELTLENIEYAFFVSRFALIAIENAFLINRIIESKRIEHEIQIAKDIQQSLLPQSVPQLENFAIGIIYKPISEVGGDYYDILKMRGANLPILIADVEGKGLPAALLAASSQAIFHSLNELYFFEPSKFISKANSLIYELTRGKRFITLFWMLLDDRKRTITYVNAGHIEPFHLSKKKIVKLSSGGFLTGFIEDAQYNQASIKLNKGDVLVAFTDGVTEVENNKGHEFGSKGVCDFIIKHQHLPAQEIADQLYKKILNVNKTKKFRDDFTLVILKAK